MKPGNLVVIYSKLDNRIRDKSSDKLIIGTLYDFVCDDQIIVILENNDLHVGPKREIKLYEEKTKKEADEKTEEKDEEENKTDI